MSNEALVKERSCIDCAVKNCDKMDKSYPEFCLTTNLNQEVYREAMACYDEEENHKTMVAAAKVEYEHYCQYTRVEEIMAFAREIGAKKIGIATCVGLLKESRTLAAIMRAHGFEVFLSREGKPLGRATVHHSVKMLSQEARVEPEKANPRCLWKMYCNTQDGIQANIDALTYQAYEYMMEKEQLTIGWAV